MDGSTGFILDNGLIESHLIRENVGKQEFTLNLSSGTKLGSLYGFLNFLCSRSKCDYNIVSINQGGHRNDIDVKFEKKVSLI